MKRLIIAAALALSSVAVFHVSAAAQEDAFKKGFSAYQQGDYAQAVKWLRIDAEEGGDSAQYLLGEIYDFGGQGVPENNTEAVKWYRLAAEQGLTAAQYNLGIMYDQGGCSGR